MDNFPSANLHQHEDIIHLEEDGVLDQKVAGEDLSRMIFDEGPPCASVLLPRWPNSILSNGACRVFYTQLDVELIGNSLFSPQGILF
jgi:hypothetical protein